MMCIRMKFLPPFQSRRFWGVLISGALFGMLIWGLLVRYHSVVATYVWEQGHSARLAMLLDGNNAALAFTIGEYYFNHGAYDIARAEAAYNRAILLRPDYKEAIYQRGRIAFINGQFADALFDMRTVLALDPEFKRAYYMHGLINGYIGNLAQAEYGFREFIKRDDFNWAGYNDLAWIYFKQGKYEETRATAKRGLEQAPGNPWLNNIYGTALLNLGEKQAAKEAFLIVRAGWRTW